MDQPRAKLENEVVSAGGVVLHRNGGAWHVALVRRHEGGWVLPKGHVIGDESLTEAALREVSEETGLDPGDLDVGDYLGGFPFRDFDGDKRPKVNHFLLMFYKRPQRKKLTTDLAHAEAAWHPLPISDVDLKYDYQAGLLAKVVSSHLARCSGS